MALAVTEKDPRLSFQESTELIRLDVNSSTNAEEKTFRYMSAFPSWVPGSDLPWEQVSISTDYIHKSTYGAHAYAMSGAAVLQAASESSAGKDSRRLDLHVCLPPTLGERLLLRQEVKGTFADQAPIIDHPGHLHHQGARRKAIYL